MIPERSTPKTASSTSGPRRTTDTGMKSCCDTANETSYRGRGATTRPMSRAATLALQIGRRVRVSRHQGAAATHPAHVARRRARDELMRTNVVGDRRSGGDHRALPQRVATDDGGVG